MSEAEIRADERDHGQTRILAGEVVAPASTRVQRMEAYDALPKTLRKVVRDAWHDWSTIDMLDELRSGMSTRRLIASIRVADKRAHEVSMRDVVGQRR